jgi:DNA repair photolyase
MSNYAIYQPKNKAAEYSAWACNFYVGCSNGCTYCYCKKGILAGAMGQVKQQLKKCFKNETHALEVFENELKANVQELQKHGLFFSFTTDPMLPETLDLTLAACGTAVHRYNIPVKVLTKCTAWVDDFLYFLSHSNSDNESLEWRKMYSFGFTLTGCDELESGAATNAERIEAMKKLHFAGFKTWASIEPIIDFKSSWNVIYKSLGYCNLYKIGLQSGKKYDSDKITLFVNQVLMFIRVDKIYFKDSLLKQAGISRESLPSNCVDRSFNL